jgi:hypothetical protein
MHVRAVGAEVFDEVFDDVFDEAVGRRHRADPCSAPPGRRRPA